MPQRQREYERHRKRDTVTPVTLQMRACIQRPVSESTVSDSKRRLRSYHSNKLLRTMRSTQHAYGELLLYYSSSGKITMKNSQRDRRVLEQKTSTENHPRSKSGGKSILSIDVFRVSSIDQLTETRELIKCGWIQLDIQMWGNMLAQSSSTYAPGGSARRDIKGRRRNTICAGIYAHKRTL